MQPPSVSAVTFDQTYQHYEENERYKTQGIKAVPVRESSHSKGGGLGDILRSQKASQKTRSMQDYQVFYCDGLQVVKAADDTLVAHFIQLAASQFNVEPEGLSMYLASGKGKAKKDYGGML